MAGGKYPARVKGLRGDRRDLREKMKAGEAMQEDDAKAWHNSDA